MSIVNFVGEMVLNASKPVGATRKLLNVEQMRQFGWQAQTSLRDGIAKAYTDFLTNAAG
jgi:GDP-L-fucose synthase